MLPRCAGEEIITMVVFPAEAPPTDVLVNTAEPVVEHEFVNSCDRPTLRDVVIKVTRDSPMMMLGVAFVAGALWSRLRR